MIFLMFISFAAWILHLLLFLFIPEKLQKDIITEYNEKGD